jgi:CubicO group peptidase (beta-lactamase class C family)
LRKRIGSGLAIGRRSIAKPAFGNDFFAVSSLYMVRHLPLLVLLVTAGCGPSGTAGDGGLPDLGPADGATAPDLAPPGPTPAEQMAFDQLVQLTRGELQQSGVPGASIAVVLRGDVILTAGVGKRDAAAPDPVTTATRFRVASLSKMIVAAAAMSVVDEGKLDLHAPITDYVPWFQLAGGFDARQITMHHLLTHTAGFPCDMFPFCGAGTRGDKQQWFAANPQPLWAPPGAVFDYSNYGYALAAVVAVTAAGADQADFETFVHDRVFARAGMADATYDSALVDAGDFAVGHVLDGNGLPQSTADPADLDCPLFNPFGGVMATAGDYAHFAATMMAGGGAMLTPSSVAAMEGTGVPTGYIPGQIYGYALEHQNTPFGDTDPLVFHDGALAGYRTEMWMVPGEKFAAVVLLNGSGGKPSHPANPEVILARALTIFVKKSQTWATPEAPDQATWQRLAGVYQDPHGRLGQVTVTYTTDGGAPALAAGSPQLGFQGAMRPGYENSDWTLPNGSQAHFYQNDGGVYDKLVTRLGVAVR